jgi:hypothetical protein
MREIYRLLGELTFRLLERQLSFGGEANNPE